MTWNSGNLVVKPRRGNVAAELGAHGRPVLDGRYDWVVTGPANLLESVAHELAPHGEQLGSALVLSFGNTVGWFEAAGLGSFEVASGKWTGQDFDRMLLDIGKVAAGLPFGQTKGGWMFERKQRIDRQVLLHQFVYLRSVLDADARADDALLPALRQILAAPHRKLERLGRRVPIDRCTSVRSQELLRIVSGAIPLMRAGASRSLLASRLGGRLPIEVDEEASSVTYDTPENRFVRSLLVELGRLLDDVEQVFVVPDRPSHRGLWAEVQRLRGLLQPFQRARLWESVGQVDRPVADSPVLQRKPGYRNCMVVHSRLRLGSRVPPLPQNLDRILAMRDIATLYELWCYFRLAELLAAWLGQPVSSDCPQPGTGQLDVPHGFRIGWQCGSELLFNARFQRGATKHSYSLPLRPDLALELRAGPHQGLHLLDAKFKVRSLQGIVGDEDDETPDPARTVKAADVHKMHTYRDAIHQARTSWVLFPGNENEFWPDSSDDAGGVGAVGFMPGQGFPALLAATVFGVPEPRVATTSG